MKISLWCVWAAAVAVLFSSCASTPQSRINRNPEAFAGLNADDQALVREGRLRIGMSPEAVALAIGRPHHIDQLVEAGKQPREIWLYTGTRPVYINTWAPPPPCGIYGRHYYGSWPQIAHIPYLRARLDFQGGALVRWEAPAGRP